MRLHTDQPRRSDPGDHQVATTLARGNEVNCRFPLYGIKAARFARHAVCGPVLASLRSGPRHDLVIHSDKVSDEARRSRRLAGPSEEAIHHRRAGLDHNTFILLAFYSINESFLPLGIIYTTVDDAPFPSTVRITPEHDRSSRTRGVENDISGEHDSIGTRC